MNLTKVCRYFSSISQDAPSRADTSVQSHKAHQGMGVFQFNLTRLTKACRYSISISKGSPRHASTSAEHAGKKSHFTELSKANHNTYSLADDSLCAEKTQQGVPVRQSTFSWLSKACQYANPVSVDSARRARMPIQFH